MPAPNLKEIEWAISELVREESSFPVYAKLANLYTVRNEMLGSVQQPQITARAEASDATHDGLEQYGESDFLKAVAGKSGAKAWAVMDELMDTLHVVNPRAYESVLRKLGRI